MIITATVAIPLTPSVAQHHVLVFAQSEAFGDIEWRSLGSDRPALDPWCPTLSLDLDPKR